MQDTGANRVWRLQARQGMEAGPLEIVESKACSDEATANIRKLRESRSGSYSSVIYQITSSGCELEFRWPAAASNDSYYMQVIRYGILLGEGKDSQIFEVH
jgi:hypothetical protein